MSGEPGPLLRLVRDRRVAFLMVGAANTLIGLIWFFIFDITVGRAIGEYGYFVTLICAYVASILCAFLLYRRFVFRVRGHFFRDLARFSLVYLTSLGISLVLLPLLVEFGHLIPIVAQTLIVAVTTTVSWFGHRFVSFRRTAHELGIPAPDEDPLAPDAPTDPPADGAPGSTKDVT
jgi:putative flippase GtrA